MTYRVSIWLRADAVFDAGMGLLLLMASWDALYEALGLPLATPPMYSAASSDENHFPGFEMTTASSSS